METHPKLKTISLIETSLTNRQHQENIDVTLLTTTTLESTWECIEHYISDNCCRKEEFIGGCNYMLLECLFKRIEDFILQEYEFQSEDSLRKLFYGLLDMRKTFMCCPIIEMSIARCLSASHLNERSGMFTQEENYLLIDDCLDWGNHKRWHKSNGQNFLTSSVVNDLFDIYACEDVRFPMDSPEKMEMLCKQVIELSEFNIYRFEDVLIVCHIFDKFREAVPARRILEQSSGADLQSLLCSILEKGFRPLTQNRLLGKYIFEILDLWLSLGESEMIISFFQLIPIITSYIEDFFLDDEVLNLILGCMEKVLSIAHPSQFPSFFSKENFETYRRVLLKDAFRQKMTKILVLLVIKLNFHNRSEPAYIEELSVLVSNDITRFLNARESNERFTTTTSFFDFIINEKRREVKQDEEGKSFTIVWARKILSFLHDYITREELEEELNSDNSFSDSDHDSEHRFSDGNDGEINDRHVRDDRRYSPRRSRSRSVERRRSHDDSDDQHRNEGRYDRRYSPRRGRSGSERRRGSHDDSDYSEDGHRNGRRYDRRYSPRRSRSGSERRRGSHDDSDYSEDRYRNQRRDDRRYSPRRSRSGNMRRRGSHNDSDYSEDGYRNKEEMIEDTHHVEVVVGVNDVVVHMMNRITQKTGTGTKEEMIEDTHHVEVVVEVNDVVVHTMILITRETVTGMNGKTIDETPHVEVVVEVWNAAGVHTMNRITRKMGTGTEGDMIDNILHIEAVVEVNDVVVHTMILITRETVTGMNGKIDRRDSPRRSRSRSVERRRGSHDESDHSEDGHRNGRRYDRQYSPRRSRSGSQRRRGSHDDSDHSGDRHRDERQNDRRDSPRRSRSRSVERRRSHDDSDDQHRNDRRYSPRRSRSGSMGRCGSHNDSDHSEGRHRNDQRYNSDREHGSSAGREYFSDENEEEDNHRHHGSDDNLEYNNTPNRNVDYDGNASDNTADYHNNSSNSDRESNNTRRSSSHNGSKKILNSDENSEERRDGEDGYESDMDDTDDDEPVAKRLRI
uniref:Uncharacterized protein n=1 Tax=Caenorhabditis tropicalis TaxID=1561998 RepID=A0A1I7T498_9PELO